MATLTRKTTPKALNKPLTIFGMDRTFLGAACPVLAVVGGVGNCWQAVAAGAALFLGICAAGRYFTRKDPSYLRYAFRQLWRGTLYDAMKRRSYRILILLPRRVNG